MVTLFNEGEQNHTPFSILDILEPIIFGTAKKKILIFKNKLQRLKEYEAQGIKAE